MTLAFAGQGPRSWPDELDAVRAAPNSRKVLFENAAVRVLEVTVPPGTKEPFDHHRLPSIFINLDAGAPTGASRYYNQDGKMTHDPPRTIKPVNDPPGWRCVRVTRDPEKAAQDEPSGSAFEPGKTRRVRKGGINPIRSQLQRLRQAQAGALSCNDPLSARRGD